MTWSRSERTEVLFCLVGWESGQVVLSLRLSPPNLLSVDEWSLHLAQQAGLCCQCLSTQSRSAPSGNFELTMSCLAPLTLTFDCRLGVCCWHTNVPFEHTSPDSGCTLDVHEEHKSRMNYCGLGSKHFMISERVFFSFVPKCVITRSYILTHSVRNLNVVLILDLSLSWVATNESLTISIDLVDHVLQLGLGRVLSQRPHHGAQLLAGDCTVSILVKQCEGFSELCNGDGIVLEGNMT